MVEKKCYDGDGNDANGNRVDDDDDDDNNNNTYMPTYYLLNATPFQNLQHRKWKTLLNPLNVQYISIWWNPY